MKLWCLLIAQLLFVCTALAACADPEVIEVEENIKRLLDGLDKKISEEELLKMVKGMKYIERTYYTMNPKYLNRLLMETSNPDQFFSFLRPGTIYHLYYYRFDPDNLKKRKNDIKKTVERLSYYMSGCIDQEGRVLYDCGQPGVGKESEKDSKVNNSYQETTTTVQPPQDPGPFTGEVRELIFQTMPDLPPEIVDVLAYLDGSFAEYVLTNSVNPGLMIRQMGGDTLRVVIQNVPSFGEILAGTDSHTITTVFYQIPYPCDYLRSLKEQTIALLKFKFPYLQNCIPPTTATTTTTPIPTTPMPTTSAEPIFTVDDLDVITAKIPEFQVLLDRIPLRKWNSANKLAVGVVNMFKMITEEDAKVLNEILENVTAETTNEELREMLLERGAEYQGVFMVAALLDN